VKNQVSGAQNGVYVVTQTGSGGAPFILTRATDFDTPGTGVNQVDAGDFFLITAGSSLANTSWVQQTPLPITMGTTAIVFSQFGAPLTYSAGTGLSESPAYTFNIANSGVTSGTYGGAATAVTLAVNAQGQITSASDVSIAIAGSQITSGTIGTSYLSGSYTGITGLGTVTVGTWNATAIGVAYGGTNLTSYTAGDTIYASGSTTLSKLALPGAGYIMTSSASAPQWSDPATITVGNASNATNASTASIANNIAGGIASQLVYQTGSGTTSFISNGTTGQVLKSNGTSAPAWGGISGGTF